MNIPSEVPMVQHGSALSPASSPPTPADTAPPSPCSPYPHARDDAMGPERCSPDLRLAGSPTECYSTERHIHRATTNKVTSKLSKRGKTPPSSAPRLNTNQMDFQEAVLTGNSLELQTLLEERQGKINVNHFDSDGQTALHQGCLDGNLDLVKVLVRFGADVRLANRDGWSPVHIACYGGHQNIALYLINGFRP